MNAKDGVRMQKAALDSNPQPAPLEAHGPALLPLRHGGAVVEAELRADLSSSSDEPSTQKPAAVSTSSSAPSVLSGGFDRADV